MDVAKKISHSGHIDGYNPSPRKRGKGLENKMRIKRGRKSADLMAIKDGKDESLLALEDHLNMINDQHATVSNTNSIQMKEACKNIDSLKSTITGIAKAAKKDMKFDPHNIRILPDRTKSVRIEPTGMMTMGQIKNIFSELKSIGYKVDIGENGIDIIVDNVVADPSVYDESLLFATLDEQLYAMNEGFKEDPEVLQIVLRNTKRTASQLTTAELVFLRAYAVWVDSRQSESYTRNFAKAALDISPQLSRGLIQLANAMDTLKYDFDVDILNKYWPQRLGPSVDRP